MTLSAGSRLGPYEIVGPLGAGGMGEVYRARDTRLGREVAIKVLPAALSADPERLKRFEREARSASSLNHPNIVTIYEIGSADSVSYIAMELVSGEALRAMLTEGALPTKPLLQIGVQVAEGLAKAHAASIVHRDLKPENVMVTEEGLVKILDFGLAKLTQAEGSGGTITQGPTVSEATEPGTLMGTVGYMSPEQALGKPMDFRSDQFSLGSILYEMATGRRAFQHGSAPQTLTAIIQDEPEPIAAVNPKVPAPVRWIIERCLAKEAKKRFASTEDLAGDLATIRDHLSETSAVGVLSESAVARRRRWWIPAAIAAGLLLGLGTIVWRVRLVDDWKSPLTGARFTRLTDWEGSELDATISSDGKFVTFIADRDGPFDVWVAQVGSRAFLNLTKGNSPLAPGITRAVGFSGDGAHVWISLAPKPGQNSISLVPTMGGTVRPFLTDAGEASWSPNRSQVLFHGAGPGDPIFLADPSGGNRRQIFVDKPGVHNHFPTWSPDGRFVYFVQGIPPNDMDVFRSRLGSGTAERLTQHHSRVAYPALIDDRTVVYVAAREDSGFGLYAVDVAKRRPHSVTSGLEEYLSVASSGDGRRLVATVANPARTLWIAPIADDLVDDAGIRRFSLPSVRASNPRFGADSLLYLSSRGGPDGLWKFKDGVETELWKGIDGVVAAAPAMSPDGAQIAFTVRAEGRSRLYLMAADGTNAHRIAESLDIGDAPSWSPDGKWLAVVAKEGKASPLFKVPSYGGAPVRLVEGVNDNPVWSPDGRFILYGEAQGGPLHRLRGVVPDGRAFPLPDVRVPYLGNRYRFLPSGKAFVLMQGRFRSQNFWLLDLTTGSIRQLTNLRPGFDMNSFDVSPDGKQILFDRYRDNSDVVLIDLPPR